MGKGTWTWDLTATLATPRGCHGRRTLSLDRVKVETLSPQTRELRGSALTEPREANLVVNWGSVNASITGLDAVWVGMNRGGDR